MRDINLQNQSTFEMGIHFTSRCTANCRICGTSSHPLHPEKMSPQKARKYIEQISSIPSYKIIGFTGGEPLIFYKEILELVGVAKSHGLRSKIATNAFWATARKTAYEKLKKLRDNGLDFISISTDAYHQEYVPLERVLNAILSALELDLAVTIAFIHKPDNGKELAKIIEFLRSFGLEDKLIFSRHLDPDIRQYLSMSYVDYIEEFKKRIYIRESTVSYGGRAMKFKNECTFYPLEEMPRDGCVQVGRVMLIMPSGNLLMCCTPIGFDDNSFSIGNIDQEGLPVLIDKVRQDRVIEYLEVRGPYYMMEALGKKGFHFNTRYTSKCHLCSQMIKKLGRKRIADALDTSENKFEIYLLKAVQNRIYSEIERER